MHEAQAGLTSIQHNQDAEHEHEHQRLSLEMVNDLR